ncbi:MAG: BA14K family protein [Roseibium sp.]
MSNQASARLCQGFITRRRCSNLLNFCLAILLATAAAFMGTLSSSAPARADSIYIGSGGVGFSFGTGGYRGGVFYGSRNYYGGRGFYGGPVRPYGPPYYYHPYDRRAYPYRSRVYPNRSRVYVNPPVRLGQPQRVPYTKNGLAPFTPEWVAYCARKFKSFSPNTGTYLAYSGKYRFCR